MLLKRLYFLLVKDSIIECIIVVEITQITKPKFSNPRLPPRLQPDIIFQFFLLKLIIFAFWKPRPSGRGSPFSPTSRHDVGTLLIWGDGVMREQWSVPWLWWCDVDDGYLLLLRLWLRLPVKDKGWFCVTRYYLCGREVGFWPKYLVVGRELWSGEMSPLLKVSDHRPHTWVLIPAY